MIRFASQRVFVVGGLCGCADPVQSVAMTVPVPAWPGLEEYPGSVLTMTISLMSPEISGPALVTLLEAGREQDCLGERDLPSQNTEVAGSRSTPRLR